MPFVSFIHLQRQSWTQNNLLMSLIQQLLQHSLPHLSLHRRHTPRLSFFCAPCCLFLCCWILARSPGCCWLTLYSPQHRHCNAPQTGRQLADPLCCFLSSTFISHQPKKKKKCVGVWVWCGGWVVLASSERLPANQWEINHFRQARARARVHNSTGFQKVQRKNERKKEQQKEMRSRPMFSPWADNHKSLFAFWNDSLRRACWG